MTITGADADPSGEEHEALWGRLGLAIVISLATHLALLAGTGWVYFAYGGPSGPDDVSDEGIVLSIVDDASATQTPGIPLDDAGPIVSELPDDALPDLPMGLPVPDPSGLGGSGNDLGALAEGLGGSGAGSGGGENLGGLGGTGGGGSAKFFGVEAAGARIAYIVDISGSMQGAKLDKLKVQLAESISGLAEHTAFFVVAFSNDLQLLGGRDKWAAATQRSKTWARNEINQLASSGGTAPQSSFELTFALSPRADAIYFMTDGQFDPSVADLIAMLNGASRKTPVHCITFGDRSAEELMRRIASESGGSYTHVEAAP